MKGKYLKIRDVANEREGGREEEGEGERERKGGRGRDMPIFLSL